MYFISVKPGNTGVLLHAGLLIIPCMNKTLDVTATGAMLLMQGLGHVQENLVLEPYLSYDFHSKIAIFPPS